MPQAKKGSKMKRPSDKAKAKPWILMLRFFDPKIRDRIVEKSKAAGDEHPATWARRQLVAALGE